jgi:hypothetical protein
MHLTQRFNPKTMRCMSHILVGFYARAYVMFAELDFWDLWLDIPVTQQYYWSLRSVPPDRT